MTFKQHEVLVIGGGPGGSTTGALLAKAGVDVAILEREAFPRFHIGESLLPASRLVLQESGAWTKLNTGKYIQKWGAHFYDYRGLPDTYFEFADGINGSHPMAFEVQRAEFDQDLLDNAVEKGAVLYQPEEALEINYFDEYVEVKSNKQTYRCKFLVDASGRDTMIGKQKNMKVANADLNNVAVFAHYENVKRPEGKMAGNIIVGILPNYAWSWFIPFLGNKTSVGVVCNAKDFRRHRHDLQGYIEECLSACPRLTEHMKESKILTKPEIVSNYSFSCNQFAGDRWILVGDAGSFLDPVFSSGVHVAVSSAKVVTQHILRARIENLLLSHPSIAGAYRDYIKLGVRRFKYVINMFYSDKWAKDIHKVIHRNNTRRAFTSILAGDVWNNENPVFQMADLN